MTENTLTRESESCAHCGTAEGRIAHVANPWTGAMVDIDLDAMTDDQFDGYVAAIADDVREDLHEAMAPCTPQAYMAAYVAMVGPKVAGIALLS